jgi:pimeloyl-ACP methyl ester carboxylesterase
MVKSCLVKPPGTATASGAGLIVWVCLAARSAARVSPDPYAESSSTSIVCTADRVIQPAWSRRVATDRLRTQAVELPGGHCPHVSRPALLAEALIATTGR